jgi:hypothetical protein
VALYRPNEFERDALLPEGEQGIDRYKPSDVCFRCGNVLDGNDYLVTKHGCEGSPLHNDDWYLEDQPQIWLHPDCAHDLALDLLSDYLAAKHIRDRKELRAKFGLPPEDEKP